MLVDFLFEGIFLLDEVICVVKVYIEFNDVFYGVVEFVKFLYNVLEGSSVFLLVLR